MRRQVEFHLRLSPKQIVERLRTVVDSDDILDLDLDVDSLKPFRGILRERRFRIYLSGRQNRNAFCPCLKGAIVSAELGSHVVIQAGMNRVVQMLVGAWIGVSIWTQTWFGLALGGIALLVGSLLGHCQLREMLARIEVLFADDILMKDRRV